MILSKNVAVGMIAVGFVVAFSSLTIVRAEYAKPLSSKNFKCSAGTACVQGNSTGANTLGVLGTATQNNGVQGQTTANGKAGVKGIATGSGSYGVYGSSSSGVGLYGTSNASTGLAGVQGYSNSSSGSGYGVVGASANGSGVVGSTTTSNGQYAGVAGFSNSLSGTGYGVAGASANGAGVYGKTTTQTGTYSYAGVFGVSSNDPGVAGESDGTCLECAALYGQADNTNGLPFVAINRARRTGCYIDSVGDMACTGGFNQWIYTAGTNKRAKGEKLLTYASQSATATIEDVGTARMSGGVADVRIDPAFASVMDGKWYYVFLTPLGDTRGLYVSMKTPTAFQVRETERGRSTLEFDYRIVAHPLGASNDRLPPAPRIRLPRALHPAH